MPETRYFIFNHEAALAGCFLEHAAWRGGAVRSSGSNARIITPALDSGEQGNRWRRVVADFDCPAGSGISFRVFSADRKPVDILVFEADNAADFLLPGVRGRYLTVEIILTGDVALRSLQIFAAWESFTDYLPEIYREPDSFTERFLALFAAQYLDMERRIDTLAGTFDPAVAPEDTLRWLAGLVGIPHLALWSAPGLRRLLAGGLWRRRGQFSAFAGWVECFTGYQPYVAEHFRFLTGREENDRLYRGEDVTVFLPPEAGGAALNLDALTLIIADFLPEGLSCRVRVLDACPVVSGYAYLGINTRVGEYDATAVGRARIGFSIVGGNRHEEREPFPDREEQLLLR